MKECVFVSAIEYKPFSDQWNFQKIYKNKVVINGVARTLEKITHIKGRLLYQAVILFSYFYNMPFKKQNFSESKEFAPRGSEFFPLRAVP